MAVKNVTFQVTANTKQATQELAKITRGLDLIQKKATIKVTADTTQATGRINNINSAITQLSRRAISLRIDTKGATNEIKRLSDSLTKANKKTSINVQAQTGQARQGLQALLDLLQKLKQKITIQVDFSAITRAAQAIDNVNKKQIRPQTRGSVEEVGGLASRINFVAQAVANSSTNFIRLRNVIARTGLALGAVSIGAAVASLGRAAVNAAKDYEVLKVAFTTFIGNATLAEQKIRDLRQFAAETPFTVDEVFKASRTLLGYGVAANELVPVIRRLGDVAGGTGAPLERIALVFGQVRAAGRLYGQDLLQLINAGFNPLQEISRTTGKSFNQLKDEMRKGLITFEQVNEAFITATSEGGKFYNLTNALANTTQGRLARLTEEWNELLRTIGEGLLPAFNALVTGGRAFVEFLRNLPKIIQDNYIAVGLLTGATVYLYTMQYRYAQLRAIVTARQIAATIATKAEAAAEAIGNGLRVIRNTLTGQYSAQLIGQTIATNAMSAATRIATAVQAGFNAVIGANPLGFLLTLLAAATTAYLAFGESVDEANDGFISSKEAFKEVDIETAKATAAQVAELDKLIKATKESATGSKERAKYIDEINSKYGTTLKNLDDEKRFVLLLNAAYGNLKVSIQEAEKAKQLEAVAGKIRDQVATVQTELLVEARDLGIQIPIEFLTDPDEIKNGFQKTRDLISNQVQQTQSYVDNLPFDIRDYLMPQITMPTVATSGAQETIIEGVISKTKDLNKTVDELTDSNRTLEAVQIELAKAPPVEPYDPLADDEKNDKDRNKAQKNRDQDLDNYKKFIKEYYDLLERIIKNRQDIREQVIEFQFRDKGGFEDEIAKLREIDKINEERVNRGIDLEIEAVRVAEFTATQKAQLINELETIRGQEQRKRELALQQKILAIEKNANEERIKLSNELSEIYAENADYRLQREIENLDKLRDGAEEAIKALTEQDQIFKRPFRFMAEPLIGDFGFQFEDARVAIDQLLSDYENVNISWEDTNKLVDEFNDKFKTTVAFTQDEVQFAKELSDAYEEIRQNVETTAKEQKRISIVQFAKKVLFEGADVPFLDELKVQQGEYLGLIEERRVAEEKRLTDKAEQDKEAIRRRKLDAGIEAIEIEKIDAELNQALTENDDEAFNKKQDRIRKDSETEQNYYKELWNVIKTDKERRIEALLELKDALFDFTKTFIDAQIQQADAAIAQQQRRITEAEKIADKGNANLLKIEKAKLDALNAERARYVRQQQSFALLEITANSAIAIAKAAAEGGGIASAITIAATLVALAAGFAQARAQAQAAATFAKGGYTGDGHQFQEAGVVHKGEFVMNAQRTRQYRPLLEAIHSGRHPELSKTVNEKVFLVNSKSTDERLERIEKAIMSQNGLQLSIDERGINGIVSKVQYKDKRLKSKF